MERHRISGVPVVENPDAKGAGKLVGILTNRDVRFAADPRQPVSELMTKEKLVTVREGARGIDPSTLAVARAYRFGWWRTLRHVILPQLAPFLLVAARSGLALIWKIVLMVELLGRSDGIGFKLHVYFEMFDVAGILAYSLAFVVVVHAIELLILAPIERKVTAWRG